MSAEVVQAVSKQSKSVVIGLTPNQIVMMSDSTTNYKYWCSIKTDVLFSSHHMEGVVGTNEFRIETNPVSLSKTLKLVNTATKSLSIRLSKFNSQPVLNIVIEDPANHTHRLREVSHNIPLQIISRRLYHEYDKQVYPVHVLFDMCNMAELANVARKMRSLDRSVTITLIRSQDPGNETGDMGVTSVAISSQVTGCTIRSVFKNVQISGQTGVPLCEDAPPDPNRIEIVVESKLLHQFLTAFQKRNANLTMGIRVDGYMTFYMSGPDFTVDYLVPALSV